MWFVQIVREEAVCVECCCKFSWMSLCLLHHHRGSALICWDRNTVWHRLGSTAHTPSDRGGLIRHEIFTQTSTRTYACLYTRRHTIALSHTFMWLHASTWNSRRCLAEPALLQSDPLSFTSHQIDYTKKWYIKINDNQNDKYIMGAIKMNNFNYTQN